MPTGRTDELVSRFGVETAAAITRAYEAAIGQSIDALGRITLTSDQRLDIVHALIDEAQAGFVDPAHLLSIALSHVSSP